MSNNGYLILIAIPAGIAILSNAVQNHLRNTKTIKDQAGYINFLLVENKRLREKLYEKYDPQKFRQEWQEEPEPVTPVHEGNKGRFSGGSL